jgi:hypothetical protein
MRGSQRMKFWLHVLVKISEKKGMNSMAADRTLDTHRVAREQQRRVTAATAIGLNALKPVVQFQVSMLKLWARVSRGSRTTMKTGRKRWLVPLSRSTRNMNGPLKANVKFLK